MSTTENAYGDPDYDAIDVLIDTDPIALGQRCRRAEADLAVAREALTEIGYRPGIAQAHAGIARQALSHLTGGDE